jgi:tetratricopeptide (TPR) repeat protein
MSAEIGVIAMQSLAQKLREGLMLHQKGDLLGAESCFREALLHKADSVDGLNLLAMVLAAQKKYGEAVTQLQRAIAVERSNPTLLGNLGGLLNEANDPLPAIRYLREAIRLKPDHIEAIVSLAGALQTAGRIEEAGKQFDRALKLQPAHARALLGKATLAQKSGNTKAAIEGFRALRKYYPNEVSPLIQILLTDKVTPGLPELRQAELRVMNQLAKRERSSLHYALAKAYDDLNRYDDAMANLMAAKSGAEVFDSNSHWHTYADLKNVFTSDFIRSRTGWGHESEVPVFIVGMPRSGTSLVEQIIASHPKAFGAGELNDLGFLAATLGVKGVRADTSVDPDLIKSLTASQLSTAATKFLDGLLLRSPKAQRITDKMPHNYERLGLIALMFPKSRIIHCRRDPVDTCLSIFMQDFTFSHPYASDLRTLGEYYRAYVELMDHWRNVLPLSILEVDYERLVANTPSEVRRIVDFLGLKWDESCLNFHRTRRNVATSSHWQVRQPIYSSSIKRWQNYRTHLEPLIAALGISTGAGR